MHINKYWLSVAIIVAAGGFGVWAGGAIRAARRPSCFIAWTASIDGQDVPIRAGTIDVGLVRARDTKCFRVALVNLGPHAIRLVRVHSSCGCLSVAGVAGDGRIEAGESRGFDVTVNVTGFRAGDFAQALTAVIAAGARASTEVLTVRGTVAVSIRFGPDVLDFGTSHANVPGRASLWFESADGDWAVTAARWFPDDGVEGLAVAMAAQEGEHRVVVEITWLGNSVHGAHERDLLVETTHPDLPRVVVGCRLFVADGVAVIPPRVVLGRCRRGVASEWCEIMIAQDGAAMRVDGVSIKAVDEGAEVVDVIVKERMPDGWRLAIRYTGVPVPGGEIVGTITIDLDGTMVSVPMRGVLVQ